MNSNTTDFESRRARQIELKNHLHSIVNSSAPRITPLRANDSFTIQIAKKLEPSKLAALGKENLPTSSVGVFKR